MKTFVRFLILIPLTLGACAPASRHDPAASAPVEVETTYEPPRPTITQEKGYNIARGATQLKDMKAQFDNETKSMRLTGAVEYLPVKGGNYQKIDVNLVGLLDEDGFIVLKPEASAAENDSITVAAKATCLSAEGTCSASFIDVYLYTEGVVYHHQIEFKEPKKEKPPVKQEDKKDTPVPAPEKEEDDVETEGEEYEGGADQVDEEAGQYVGSVHEDIETILKVKPTIVEEKPTTKEERDERAAKELEKKKKQQEEEAKKQAEAKKQEDAKKKETPKKDEPKKDDPKKETPKKDEPKKEDPKKTDPKKDDNQDIGENIPKPIPRPEHEPEKEKEKEKESEPVVAKPKIAKSNQAIGAVNSGRLENAVNMKQWQDTKGPVGFHIIRPERKTHFATNELAYLIDMIGKVTSQMIPGYKLAIGDLSKEKGGKVGKHLSHTNGLDADIAFYFDNKTFQGHFASALSVSKPHHNWMPEEQWKLYKVIVRTQLIDRIFIHETLKKEICKIAIKNGEVNKDTKSGPVYETLRRLVADRDHITHFHLRAKCSSAQVRCRQMAEPRPGTGCF